MSKTIIISGANGNLGRAVVDQLLPEGWTVEATLGPWGELDTDREGLYCQAVDLLDEEAVHAYLEAVRQRRARIDAAVLIAGGFAMAPLAETDNSLLDKMIDLNFRTAFHLVRPLYRQYVEQGGGRFIFIGARPAFHPAAGSGAFAYALSKGMVGQMAELINSGPDKAHVRAAVIAPSIIDTPANRKAMPDADFSNWVPPARIAEGVRFLLSDSGRMLHHPVLEIYNRS